MEPGARSGIGGLRRRGDAGTRGKALDRVRSLARIQLNRRRDQPVDSGSGEASNLLGDFIFGTDQ